MDYPLPQDKEGLDALNKRLLKADPELQREETAYADYRKATLDPDWLMASTCGNCRNICWADREDRKKNYKLLANSGVVVLGSDGERVVPTDTLEILELDTPHIVRVAVSKDDYRKALTSKHPSNGKRGITLIDKEVLSSIL